jgi:hypothetical protein
MIKLTKKSPISGVMVTMEIGTTELKIAIWDSWDRAKGTPLIQEFFPECNAQEREFILTGILPFEWDLLFNKMENDD